MTKQNKTKVKRLVCAEKCGWSFKYERQRERERDRGPSFHETRKQGSETRWEVGHTQLRRPQKLPPIYRLNMTK